MPPAGLVDVLYVIAVFGVFVLMAYAVIVLVARTLHRFMPATTPPRDPALDALRTRLATGAIDDAEYERLRHVLQRR
jgi:uncharacterized membrane protein